MAERISSQAWYRVADLKPRLRTHTQIHRHTYRQHAWYVIQDHSTGRFTRISAEAYAIIGQMNGQLSLNTIWENACERLGDDMPTQDEVIQLVGQLHQSNILQLNMPPDIQELQRRHQKRKRQKFWQMLKSPLAIRLPLFDPENFLSRTYPYVSFIFQRHFLYAWLVLIAIGLLLMGLHWEPLTKNMSDRILSLENLLVLWWVYPVVKLFHEFSHAYAVKHWGGEVHEMGIMFLIFMPIPYVDASAASAIRDKQPRMLISAMGMMTELSLAALAMLLWALVEPGMVRSIAYNVMLIAGVSTLLMNGNPLLRYDGYYIFSDLLEIPNLAQRANQYIGYWVQRYILRSADARSPAHVRSERGWLGFYAIAAYIYRIFLTLSIALFVASKFFVVGVLLAMFSLWTSFVKPVVNMMKTILTDARVRPYRQRALAWLAGGVALLGLLVFILPMPSSTISEGIVWIPERVEVRAGTDGFIQQVLVASGSQVKKDAPLIQNASGFLQARVGELEARLLEYLARYDEKRTSNRTEAQILQEEVTRLRSEVKSAREEYAALEIRSPASGLFLLKESADDLLHRYLQRGTVLGYIVNADQLTVRVAMPQADVDLVRQSTTSVRVRMAENISNDMTAVIKREVPAASNKLPSPALSVEGGGRFAIDPTSKGKDEVLEALFQFDLQVPAGQYGPRVGERVYVRFEHNPEPLASRIYRAVRRLFLSQFDV